MIIIPPRWFYLVGTVIMLASGIFLLVVFVQTIDASQGLVLSGAFCGFAAAYRAWKAAKVDIRTIPHSLGRTVRHLKSKV
jgi:hypothetical protein